MRSTVRLAVAAFLLGALAPVAFGQGPSSYWLSTPDGTNVSVERDDYGVPYIEANTEAAVFFGQGFAAAQDRLFQMETFWRAATGRLAEIQGPSALSQDRGVRTVFYTPEERAAQFAALRPEVQTMITAYVAGVNAYIDSTAADPAEYLPAQYALGGFTPEPWDVDRAVAVLQFFMRRFGEIGGDELARLAELEANGPDWFAANRPVDDPAAATTLPAPVAARPWSPRAVADYPAGTAALAARAAAEVAQARAERDALYSALGVPLAFGSFAATVPPGLSQTGEAMLLGAPQMGAPSASAPSVTSEVVLTLAGGDPFYLLAGMTVPGIPGVIIGRTSGGYPGGAWTLTTGYTDNTDTFLEQLDASGEQYLFDGELHPFEVLTSEIGVAGQAPVTHTSRRSVHGPVYSLDAATGLAAAWQYAFWDRELEMVEALYDVWTTAEDVASAQAAIDEVPMSFNFFWASDSGTASYWHLGRYPERPASADPRLPLSGTGGDEWTGVVPFSAHPQLTDAPFPLANWNNKPAPGWPQGDNVSWTANPPGGYARPFDGVVFLQDHLAAASPEVTIAELQELTRVVRSNGTYNEYPGTYQQLVHGAPCGFGTETLTVAPPGQSAHLRLVDGQPIPSPHAADQWPLYQSSADTGPIEMKSLYLPFLCPSTEPGAEAGGRLGPPAPNPAAGTLTLTVELDTPASVRLSVVDALGREVAVVAEGRRPAGAWSASLDARALAPGVYVARLQAGGATQSRRFVVAR